MDQAEQRFFQRLAVFTGGCTLEAVEYVCSALNKQSSSDEEVLDLLSSLIDKSLLFIQQTQANSHSTYEDEPRFCMLEVIREYALELLEAGGELEAALQAHTDYYLGLAEQAYDHVLVEDQDLWLKRLESEHANLLAILKRTHTYRQIKSESLLASLLWPFWLARGHIKEGRQWLEGLLDQKSAILSALTEKQSAEKIWQRILHGVGLFALQCAEEEKAAAFLEVLPGK